MFIGIDLGTSGVKAVLLDRDGQVRFTSVQPIGISRPQPRWSEQDPEEWWTATSTAVAELLAQAEAAGVATAKIEAIGLTGQMHGATLLDEKGKVLRPAILWNDGRSDIECAELEAAAPQLHVEAGNLAMPGFTAPKLLWVRKHEPEIFARVAQVLLPKDYLRYRLTGIFATDPSDAAGTLWLDVAKRDYSETLLKVCGLTRDQMPKSIGNRMKPYDRTARASPPIVRLRAITVPGSTHSGGVRARAAATSTRRAQYRAALRRCRAEWTAPESAIQDTGRT